MDIRIEEVKDGQIRLTYKREAVKNMDGFEIELCDKEGNADVARLIHFQLIDEYNAKARECSIPAIIKETK